MRLGNGELCKGFPQDIVGDALFRWVIDGQLPLSGLHGATSSFVILLSTILQKPVKGNTGLYRLCRTSYRLRFRSRGGEAGGDGGGRLRKR